MYSPWIRQCLGGEPLFLLHLLLVVQAADGSLHGINFFDLGFCEALQSFCQWSFPPFLFFGLSEH